MIGTASKMISIQSPEGGTFDAYLAYPPEAGPAPAIVVVPSIIGITDGLKETMDRYATKGYYVIAADPFWRTQPGPLDHTRSAEARARMGKWKLDEGRSDMRATLAVLETLPNWNHKFAVLGFCFGGVHAMLGLTELGADAGIAFHGVGIERLLADAGNITKPFSFHFGEHDPIVPLDVVEQIRSGLAGKDGEVTVHAGAPHGFAQQESANYHPEAAELSEERAFAILERMKSTASV